MKLGNKIFLIFFLGMISIEVSFAEQKITTSTLINIDDIKPSFEELDEKNDGINSEQSLKQKNWYLQFQTDKYLLPKNG